MNIGIKRTTPDISPLLGCKQNIHTYPKEIHITETRVYSIQSRLRDSH